MSVYVDSYHFMKINLLSLFKFENEHLLNMIILLSLLFFSSVVCLNVSKGELLDISKLLKDFQVSKTRRSIQRLRLYDSDFNALSSLCSLSAL